MQVLFLDWEIRDPSRMERDGLSNIHGVPSVSQRLSFVPHMTIYLGFPGGTSGKESACPCKRHKACGFNPWIEKIPLEEDMATHSSILA